MPKLSPAAQKILRSDAAVRCLAEWSSVNDPPCHPSDEGWNGCGTCVNRAAVAAALEAAADQVVPEDPKECEHFTNEAIRLNRMGVRAELLAIAVELNGDSNV